MRFRWTGLPAALALLIPLGCGDPSSPVAPEVQVVELTVPVAVKELLPGPSAAPPADIQVGDPMTLTVHYRPAEGVVSIDESSVARYNFFPADDAWVDVEIGEHSWRLSLREITIYDDSGYGYDGVEIVAGRQVADPLHITVLLWDDVAPLDLFPDTSLPEQASELPLDSVVAGRITVGTWYNDGAFWFVGGVFAG